MSGSTNPGTGTAKPNGNGPATLSEPAHSTKSGDQFLSPHFFAKGVNQTIDIHISEASASDANDSSDRESTSSRSDGGAHASLSVLEHRMQVQEVKDKSVSQSLAAWAILLGTYAGSREAAFLVGGHEDHLEPTPLRASVDDSLTVSDLLQSLERQCSTVLPRANTDTLTIQSFAARNGNYATIQNLPDVTSDRHSSPSHGSRSGQDQSAVEVKLDIDNGSVLVTATFDGSVLEPKQVHRILHQFEHILRQISSDTSSNKQLGELELFSPEDASEVTSWNSISPPYIDSCAHILIEQQANRRPAAPAVSAWDAELTYSTLNDLSNRLAHHLKGLGVGPEVLVPFCFDKSAWAVVSMLAILKAGGACIGLDGNHPLARLKQVVDDSGATVVLTSERHRARLSSLHINAITIDEAFLRSLSPQSHVPSTLVTSKNAAYVTFTSGTTGQPKGIVIEHQAICSSGASQRSALRLGPSSRVLQFAAYSFDISNGDILNTLMNGGCICVPSEDERSNDLAVFINRMHVNWACLTPSVASILQPSAVPTLRTLVLCGEPIKQEVVRTWADVVYLVDAYGPAETTILCTSHPGVKPDTSSANLGWNMGAVSWIANPSNHNQLQPLGCAGEILIEGPLLSRGYLNDPEKTAHSFIEGPRWAGLQDGSPRRFYKSGDLGFFNPDGSITFVCRKDTQVKIRGQRVELHDIEHHLRSVLPPTVGPVVADVVPVEFRSVLVAFVSLGGRLDHEVDFRNIPEATRALLASSIEGVTSKLANLLPTHMIPSVFLPLKDVPLNRSGKVDRARLRELVSGLPLGDAAAVAPIKDRRAPSTDLEEQLNDHCARVLGVDPQTLSMDDNFIKVGGDSLTAMKLVASCRASGIPLQVSTVLRSPTLADLAASAADVEDQYQEEDILPFSLLDATHSVETLMEEILAQCSDINEPDMILDAYPCTPLQEGLMALSHKQQGSYVAQDITELPADLNMAKFREAWAQVIEACDVLRTRLIHNSLDSQGAAIQIVLKSMGPWTEITVPNSGAIQRYLEDDRSNVMDFGQPLSRWAVIIDASTGARHFVWTIHHAVYDGWSMPLIKDMVETVYAGGTVEKPTKFNRFVQKVKHLQEETIDDFWRFYFEDCEAPLFPSISPPTYQPHAQSILDHTFHISRQRDTSYTLATVLRAAFARLVGCYAGSDDVVFGVTLAGRNAPITKIDTLVGPTIATLPVRVRWDESSTIDEFLSSVQDQSLAMMPFEHSGLQNIQKVSEAARLACQFQSLLIIQPLPEVTAQHAFSAGKVMGGELADYGAYAFIVQCMLNGDEVIVKVTYDEKVVDHSQARRYVGHFEHLVRQLLVLGGTIALGSIESVNAEDLAEISRWNSSPLEYIDSSFQSVFSTQVQRAPDAAAVCGWDGTFTYAELDGLSTRLAHHLVDVAGVKPDAFVPLCFEKSRWTVVAMMAVIKAGACVVTMDPFHPKSRLHTIASSVQATAVLCSKQYASIFHGVSDHVPVVDETLCAGLPESSSSLLPESSAQTALYTIFTSGSTGTPKGVITDHGAFLSSAKAYGNGFLMDSQTRVLQYSSYSFDVTILEILTPLMFGACICVVSDDERLNDLGAAIRKLQANWALLTPTVARTVDPKTVPTLKVLLLGAEPLDHHDIIQWEPYIPNLFESYGPSEASVISSAFTGLNSTTNPRNIGRAFNARYWITAADDPHKLVPVGTVGELLIEGPILAREYLGDPEKTAKSFVTGLAWAMDEHGSAPRRFYRTGDLVHYDTNGCVIYQGRRDTQIKLRGQRIELGEVQHHLLRCIPDIQTAAVEVVNAGSGDTPAMLVAFLCLQNAQGAHDETGSHDYLAPETPSRTAFLSALPSIQAQLATALPKAMIPSLFLPLWRLPMTTSQKLDRKKLREMVQQLSSEELDVFRGAATSGRKPTTAEEAQLQSLWSKVLSLDTTRISAEDSFLDLGGDSIQAIRLVAACRTQGLSLSVPQIFQNPKLADMALLLAKADAPSAATAPFELVDNTHLHDFQARAAAQCGVSREDIEDIYPCTALQEGLFISSAKTPGSYVARHVIELPADVVLNRFQSAIEAVVERTPVLRTRIFQSSQPKLLQVVLRRELVTWCLEHATLDTILAKYDQASMSFGEPLAKYVLVQDPAIQKYHFVWITHHALYDGWAVILLKKLVNQAYQSLRSEQITQVPYNNLVKYTLETDNSDVAKQFWRGYLEGSLQPAFPVVPPGKRSCADQLFSHRMVLEDRRSSNHFTISTVLRAAWALLVQSYSGSSDVVFGTTLSGRDVPVDGIDRIVGPVLATVPVRVALYKDANSVSIEAFLQTIQDHMAQMIPYQHMGIQSIQRVSEDAQVACQFQNLISVQPAEEEDTGICSSWSNAAKDLHRFNPYALMVRCDLEQPVETNKMTVSIGASYDSRILDETQMGRMMQQFEHIANGILASSRTDMVGNIELVSPQDKQELITWNDPNLLKPTIGCLHDGLRSTACSNPTSIAVTSWDGELTYADVDRLSDQLCALLYRHGVRRGSFVALCFEKTKWMVVAVFATLKAGAAVVSLDCKHPVSRLEQIVTSVDARVLLTSKTCVSLLDKKAEAIVLDQLDFSQLPPSEPSQEAAQPSDVAEVVFTSGSTGTPKGYVIEHRAMFSSGMAFGKAYSLTAQSRVFQFGSYAHDVMVLEIIVPLLFGACICIPTEEERLANTAGAMRRMHVNWAFFTPSVARLINPSEVPGLSVLVLGGEALSEGDIHQWSGHVDHLINGYGPGECSIFSSANIDVAPGDDARNIGKTFNAHYWVASADDVNRLCPLGGIGELLIEGPILAQGYLNMPEKTAATFIDPPRWARELATTLETDRKRTLYRTGDMVRYATDGSIIFLGRIDNQVKIRGQRTELSEVEYQLRRALPSVTATVAEFVQLQEDVLKKTLVGFLCFGHGGDGEDGTIMFPDTLDDKISSELAAINDRLSESLPIYMIPSYFIPFLHFPLTRSGKTDRRKLHQMACKMSPTDIAAYAALTADTREKQEPCTQMEKLLRDHWAATLKLGLNAIGRDDHFFKLGGDSITAIHLVTSLRNSGWSLLTSDLFSTPVLCNMALKITEVEAEEDLDPEPFSLFESGGGESVPEEILAQCGFAGCAELVEDMYPTTPLQEGLMALSIKEQGSYVAQFLMDLTAAEIDINRFRAAWERLAEQVPILRTRLVNTTDRGSLQVVVKEPIGWLSGDDLGSYLEKDHAAAMSFGQRLARYAIVSGPAGHQHFVWTVHHGLYDGWTVRLILEKVHRLYTGESALPLAGFSRYIKHIMEVDETIGDESEEFWRNQLEGASPSEFPALPSTTYQPQPDRILHHVFELPVPTQPGGYTMSTLVWAAWALVVSRYTGSPDVIFGTILSGRYASVADIEDILGPTMNTVPIRHKIDLDQTVEDYLDAFQEQATGMIPFETFGLQRMQRLGPGASEACQFKSLLVVQPKQDAEAGGFNKIVTTHNDIDFAAYPLALDCNMDAAETMVEVTATYDSNVLDERQMRRVLGHFQHAIAQLCIATTTPISKLEVLSVSDMQEISQWNGQVFPPVEKYLDGIVAESVALHPNATAVDAWDGRFTYAELDRLSTSLAYRLVQLGVGPDVTVPLCFAKSKWVVVAMLATSKAGGAFVPMDPSQPLARLQSILTQTRSMTVLCSPQHFALFTSLCENTVILGDDYLEQHEPIPADALHGRHKSPEDSAYIIFTSGSTGEPKGCVLTHQAYCSSVTAYAKDLVDSSTRALQFASYSFDACILEIFTPLVTGGCVCIPSDHSRLDDIAGTISDMRINWAALTPSMAKVVDPVDVPSLKTLLIGGEALSKEDVARWHGHGAHLFHMYGPTECAVVASRFARITEGTHPNNIGLPYASNFWIVDPKDHNLLLPVGAVGELLIDGPILARGYLNDLEKTAASFIEWPKWLPHGQQPRRMYKTGDLVRYNSDGTVNFVGRNDTQIKLRGLRIQLDEVEHHLRNALAPSILGIVAELVHVERKPMLVAFLSVDDLRSEEDLFNVDAPAKMELAAVISRVEDSLAASMHSHMIPSAYIPIRGIPATIAGKTDRARLRRFVSGLSSDQLDELKVQVVEKHTEPSTKIERKLRAAWATVLRVEKETISARDSFFKLGGDSIMAIRLVGACRADGMLLSATDVFRRPRLCDMALTVEVSGDEGGDEEEIAAFSLLGPAMRGTTKDGIIRYAAKECGVGDDDVEDVYPCTALQEGLMAITIKLPGTYTAQGVVELSEDVDLKKFKGAWESTVEANPILRTRIIQASSYTGSAAGDGFVQVVLRESVSWFEGGSLEGYCTHDKQRPIGLGGVLSRYALINDEASGHRYFVWTVHHALYDGWSLSLILKSVDDAYKQGKPKTPVGFKRYISYLAERQNNTASEEYWRTSLQGAAPPAFPSSASPTTRKPLPDSTLRHSIKIPVDHQSASASFTTSTIIRAAWALLISRYTDSHDVVFGAVTTGRTAPVRGIEEMAGPTVNTVPIRTIVDSQKSVVGYLRQVQAHATDLIPFETFGLQKIQRLSEAAYAACQFRNLLVIQPEPAVGSNLICPVQPTAAGDLFDNLSTYAMGMQCSLGKDGIDVFAGYDSNIIGHKQMQRLMRQFDHLIQQLCQADEALLVRDIELLSPSDREEISSWVGTPLEEPQLCLDEMIHASVCQNRGRSAINAWDGNFTYDELDQAANILAHHLIASGVGPEVKVPLCFQKSKWMIVAMLAIVKAGGAMVPLDPAHPQSRLEFIINAVDATVVLCSADQADWINELGKVAIAVDNTLMGNLPIPDSPVSGRTRLSDALYVIFTSGSSGEPKGCVVEHRGFCSIVPHLAKGVLFGPEIRILQLASYSFGAANAEILSTLLHGGCLCIVPNEARANLPRVIKEMNINYMFMSPTFSRLIPPQAIPTVKTLLLGAESMSTADLEKWTPHVSIVQGYGQTECATMSACHPLMTTTSHPRDVGRPIGSRFWIVDASDHNILAPLGAVGELLIEGPVLARGYLNDPEKTAAAFIEPPSWHDSFSFGSCERMYRTGDLACFSDDGSILFMGRKDNQVNLRGQRVELGEIEHHLRRCIPASKGIVVELLEMPMVDSETHSALVAFVALGPDVVSPTSDLGMVDPVAMKALLPLISGLSSGLSQVLPPYMIPPAYIPVAAIPTTTSGKVNRRELRAMASGLTIETLASYSLSTIARREPSTEMEKRLQKLWRTVLPPGVGDIGADDQFLHIGGDSISAIKLVSACRAEGLTISVADIFKHSTLSAMATVVQEVEAEGQSMHPPFLSLQVGSEKEVLAEMVRRNVVKEEEEVEDIMETTYMQASFVACGLMEMRSKTNYISLDFSVPIDTDRMVAACRMLVTRHQILRTVFIPHQQQLLQVVLRDFPGEFKHYRCDNVQSFAATIIKEDDTKDTFGKSFIRFLFFDASANGFRLTIRINHAQFDGMSFPLVIADLASLYRDTGGIAPHFPPFSDFICNAREMHDAGAIDFYRDLLAGASMTNIPTNPLPPFHNAPATQALRHRIPRVTFPSRGITFPIVLKAAWAMVLSTITDRNDILFGYLVSGRSLPIPRIEEVVGPCINITPVRVHTQQRNSIQELLDTVRDQNLEAMPFETYSLEKIVKHCTDWPRHTRFSTIVQCQHVAIEEGTVEFGEGVEARLSATNEASDLADLLVDAMPLGGDGGEEMMSVQFLYSEERVKTELVERMAGLLAMYLERIQKGLEGALEVGSEEEEEGNEEIVMRVWERVFGAGEEGGAEIGLDAPFFELWGSTVAAAQLAEEYKMEGRSVEMEQVVQCPTMREQIRLLASKGLNA